MGTDVSNCSYARVNPHIKALEEKMEADQREIEYLVKKMADERRDAQRKVAESGKLHMEGERW
jgi:hypothetical protein